MKTPFLTENFLLFSEQSRELYHEHAKRMPIIDFHCHLDPVLIAEDHQFENMWELWLRGDHYKWRAMRANGVSEDFITGQASPDEKFRKWAETVPYTLRNPLYHWTHLELLRYFGISQLLSPHTANEVYDVCNARLKDAEFSCRNLLRKMNVEVVCTTDDPVDDLKAHEKIAEDRFEIKVLPTFRPDKACHIERADTYNRYLDQLEEKSGVRIRNFDDLVNALEVRHDYFHKHGCRLSDHGLTTFLPVLPPDSSVDKIFKRIREGRPLDPNASGKLQNTILLELAKMNHSKGWVQQFHYGALRNNNSAMFERLGPDAGFDSMGDYPVARAMSRFFNYLRSANQLAKTIIYNLNPADNHMVASMTGNFQEGPEPGKIQYGAAWWFMDHKDGIEQQINALSNLGLLSRFVGMLTDSRSFLSYPRHEYFRRILCNLVGEDMKNGLIPNDMNMAGEMVKAISYTNARNYFGFIPE